ncbi:MAG TPA: hypothetical protein VEL49_04600 [Ktedonobacteraceae bacterium]|nr:hypothetical protein [Ktedonobacteraceae bacterium]
MKYTKNSLISSFRSFFASSGGTAFDTVEVDESPTLATDSTSDVAKNAHANYRKWMILIFIFYVVLSYLLFAFSIGLNLTTSYIGKSSHDQMQFIWTLYWWPYAISHHLNPLFSTYIWHPYGIDLSISPASVPGASFLALPITLLFGPVASYNLLIILGSALSAFLTFLIIHSLTKSYQAGVIAGLLFGFSTYQFVQVTHLHVELTFVIPLLGYLVLLWWEKKIGSRTFILLVGGCLTLQYLIAIEVFVTLTIFIAIAIIIFMLVYPEHFKQLLHFLLNLSGAYALCIILLSPFIYIALKNKIPTTPLYSAIRYSIDPLNFIIPTQATYIGANAFAQLSNTFLGNLTENSAYLGIPVLAIILVYAIKYWHEKMTRVLFLTLLCFMILSLGPKLHIAGYITIMLPEYFLNKLPIINQLLPSRLTVYSFFVASLMIGFWVGKNLTGLRAGSKELSLYGKYLLILCALILLFPNVRGGTPHTDIHIPYFFTSGIYKQYIHNGDNVLVLPYAGNGDSMLYQDYTNMYFNIPEGYVGPWVLAPREFVKNPMTTKLSNIPQKPLTSHDLNDFKKFLHDFKVHEIVFPQSEYYSLEPVISGLGISPVNIEGMMVLSL